MSHLVDVPLDSLRYAEHPVSVACFLCGGANICEAERCHYCAAPMALVHQSANPKSRTSIVAVLGGAGAGKTVYLGMLMDILSRQTAGISALMRGAFSVNLQQTTVSALAHCRFPEPTPEEPRNWHWVHCQARLTGNRRTCEIVMPDLPGEVLRKAVEGERGQPAVNAVLSRAAGAILLVDAAALSHGEDEAHYTAMKLLSYLSELGEGRSSWHNRPVAVVFTKADACEPCAADPHAFAADHATALWHQCRERFRQHQFFACRVAGACAKVDDGLDGPREVPLRIEPSGVVEPFDWLIRRLR